MIRSDEDLKDFHVEFVKIDLVKYKNKILIFKVGLGLRKVEIVEVIELGNTYIILIIRL